MTSPSSPLPLRTCLAAGAGLMTAALSKSLGRGEGSVIGGRVSLVIDPKSLERLARGRNVALVSGTNGKTTTTSLLVAALQGRGPVATNLAGANMFGGMVSALSASSAQTVVLEVDEGHLPKAVAMTEPKVIVLLNLSRDQLDRVGEVRMQAQKWRDAVNGSRAVVVANADDPIVVWSAQTAQSVVWVAAGNTWRLDAASCPQCGARINWRGDTWQCSGCELKRPRPHAFFQSPTDGNGGAANDIHMDVDLMLPGEVNRRNAAVALTAAVIMGAVPDKALKSVSALPGVGGRFTSVCIGGVSVRLILAKNPAGWTEALRIARPGSDPVVVSINARVQDGRDPSWLWDVPFEQLVGRYVVATGERGRDLAVRLRYAEVEHDYVTEPLVAVARARQRLAVGRHDEEIDVLGNYSAFQDFRKLAAQ